MASLTVISWRDIPAQVIVKRGRETAKVKLSDRFHEAVDRAAMRAGKGSSDAYLSEWCRKTSSFESDDDLAVLAATEVARLEAGISDEQLLVLIRKQGLADTPASAS